MCRNLISVDWRGYVYDCDFNQMLDLPLRHGGTRAHAPRRSARCRPRRRADSRRRPLLRLHRRPGLELRRRAEGSGGVTAHPRRIHAPRTRGRLPDASARPIIATRPRSSTGRPISPPTCCTWSAGSTAISPRSTPSSGSPPPSTPPSCSTAISTGSTPSRTGSPRSSGGSVTIMPCAATSRPRWRAADDIGAGCGCAYPEHGRRGRGAPLERHPRTVAPHGQRATGRPRAARRVCRCISSPGRRICASASCTAMRPRWPAGPSRTTRSTARPQCPRSKRCAGLRVSTCSPRPIPASPRCATAALPSGRLTVINNGAAGMPNFRGSRDGLISRIAVHALAAPAALRACARRRAYRRHRPCPTTSEAFRDALSRPLARGIAGACVLFLAHRGRPRSHDRRAPVDGRQLISHCPAKGGDPSYAAARARAPRVHRAPAPTPCRSSRSSFPSWTKAKALPRPSTRCPTCARSATR